jgi:hypothetical protein
VKVEVPELPEIKKEFQWKDLFKLEGRRPLPRWRDSIPVDEQEAEEYIEFWEEQEAEYYFKRHTNILDEKRKPDYIKAMEANRNIGNRRR